MSQVQTVRFVWTPRDADVLCSLKTHLKLEGRTEFCADDLYLANLDRFFKDKVHEIGGWFASALHYGYIVRTGKEKPSTRPSNKSRRVDVCTFAEKETVQR